MNEQELEQFFNGQLESWDLACQNYNGLASVQLREMSLNGCNFGVQFNPTRIVSTGASIDKQTIAQRPCFLCAKNRPPEQVAVPMLGRYELLVNPFPILTRHFTLPSLKHEPQRILESYLDLIHMAELLPSLFLFYNGPRCGASAPDHLHFQAGQRGIVPLERDFSQQYHPHVLGISPLQNYLVPAWSILASTPEESNRLFLSLYNSMPSDKESGEPMINILCWYEADEKVFITIVIPRHKHRPDCYYAENGEKYLISPGAIDMGGLIITPRKEDFDRLTAEQVGHILKEVAS